ncbi:allantoinase AllB [Microbacterium sp. No. 7]|uniref:allantoinase AllB n=1 Tax=Microbacterium sp. No. 7 TaxID=1714373 RepID=UPI0006D0DE5E|nr:allantoinase AllB [Microbacterium sp. No. 7]ALJ21120.1 hypothetical protein AOA12_14895 [Microbacterium sp. No. 7]
MSADEFDLVIRKGRIVLPDRVIAGDVGVTGGRIAAIGPELAGNGRAEVDASGLVVMAGMIDTHVHLRDPGHPQRENFATGTAAAAKGGITTVLEMPSGIPAVADAESWRHKLALVAPKAHVDFGLYGGAGASNLDRIAEQAAVGAIAFKSFMIPPGPLSDPGIESRSLADDVSFLRAMREIRAAERVAVVHAENGGLCAHFAAEQRARGRNDLQAHADSRPPITEVEAVSRAIVLGAEAAVRLSFAHVSTRGAVEQIRRAKASGLTVTAEACPHHLLLGTSERPALGPFGKINPPLRDREHREALWAGLLDGTIDFIGTDHAPYTAADKEPGWASIWDAPAGGHGLETALAVLLTQVAGGRLTLPQLTRIVSLNAAKVFGLHPRKGELRPGADADLILVDTERAAEFSAESSVSVSRDGARLWEGYPTIGAVLATYVRGELVMRDGDIVGPRGFGRLVTAERSARPA